MNNGHNPKLHLGMTLQEAKKSTFRSGIANGPPLPAVTYELVGKQATRLLPASEGEAAEGVGGGDYVGRRVMGGAAARFLRVQLHHVVQRQDARHVDWLGEIFELAVYKVDLPLHSHLRKSRYVRHSNSSTTAAKSTIRARKA